MYELQGNEWLSQFLSWKNDYKNCSWTFFKTLRNIFNATCQIMLCNQKCSYCTKDTFTSKTSFRSPPPPLAQSASLKTHFCASPSATVLAAIPQRLETFAHTFLENCRKKRFWKFSHLFFPSFLEKPGSRFELKKGDKFQSSFNSSPTLKNTKIFCLLSLLPWETRAQKWPCAHTCSQLFPALIAWLEKIFVRAQKVCET